MCKGESHRPEEDVGPQGTGLTGGCELPNLAAGTQTWVLWKNSKYS